MKMLNKIKETADKGVVLVYSVPGKICSAVCLLMTVLLKQVSPVFAAGNEYDFLTEGGNGMFDDFINTVNKTAASGLNFFRALGYILLFAAIASVAIGFMVWRNPQETSMNKKKMLVIVAAAVLIFGAGSLASMIAGAGDSL